MRAPVPVRYLLLCPPCLFTPIPYPHVTPFTHLWLLDLTFDYPHLDYVVIVTPSPTRSSCCYCCGLPFTFPVWFGSFVCLLLPAVTACVYVTFYLRVYALPFPYLRSYRCDIYLRLVVAVWLRVPHLLTPTVVTLYAFVGYTDLHGTRCPDILTFAHLIPRFGYSILSSRLHTHTLHSFISVGRYTVTFPTPLRAVTVLPLPAFLPHGSATRV